MTEGVAAMVLRRVVRWVLLEDEVEAGLRRGVRALGGIVEMRWVWVVVFESAVVVLDVLTEGLCVICGR